MPKTGAAKLVQRFWTFLSFLTISLSPSSAIAMNQYVYIDKTGRETTAPKIPQLPPGVKPQPGFAYIQKSFTDGRAWYRSGSLYGYMDESGKVVIQPKFECAGYFSEGAAICNLPGKDFVVIDKNETKIGKLPSECSPQPGGFHDGLAGCWFGTGQNKLNQNAFVDKSGKLAFPPTEKVVYEYSDGLVLFSIQNENKRLNGYLDKNGHEVIPALYETAYPFHEGLAAVQRDGAWSFIDTTGKISIKLPSDCKAVASFSEGLAAVAFGGEVIKNPTSRSILERFGKLVNAKLGFIDKSGKLIIPAKFYAPTSVRWVLFSNGLAAVPIAQNGYLAWGFIDHSGNFVVPAVYRNVYDFDKGKAKVVKGTFGFDKQDWALNPFHHPGLRISLFEELIREKKLIGMNKTEVLKLLGEPEEGRSMERGSETLKYTLISSTCGNAHVSLKIQCIGSKVVRYQKLGYEWADAPVGTNGSPPKFPFEYQL